MENSKSKHVVGWVVDLHNWCIWFCVQDPNEDDLERIWSMGIEEFAAVYPRFAIADLEMGIMAQQILQLSRDGDSIEQISVKLDLGHDHADP